MTKLLPAAYFYAWTPSAAAIIFLLLSPGSTQASPEADKGHAIAKLTDASNSGYKGELAEQELTLINAHGDKVVRKLKMKTKEFPADGDKSIATFVWPPDVNGTRMLTWSHKVGDDDQWLYLPTVKRVKRINSSNKSGSFMGSEFSYEDLSSLEIEKFTFKLLKEEEIVGGRKTWVLERTPVDKSSGYSRQSVWMDKEYHNPIKIEYYDLKGELLKTAEFSNYSQFGKYWRMGEIAILNHQTKKKSILTWVKREMGQEFLDAEFESRKLEE